MAENLQRYMIHMSKHLSSPTLFILATMSQARRPGDVVIENISSDWVVISRRYQNIANSDSGIGNAWSRGLVKYSSLATKSLRKTGLFRESLLIRLETDVAWMNFLRELI